VREGANVRTREIRPESVTRGWVSARVGTGSRRPRPADDEDDGEKNDVAAADGVIGVRSGRVALHWTHGRPTGPG